MTTQTKQRGFTIVELLIVVVIIAILAAITTVAYNGIQNRANASTAKAVAEVYNADDANAGIYPALAALTAYAGVSRVPSGITLVATTLTATAKDGKTIQYIPVGTTGACIGYWDNSLGTPAAAYVYAGNAKTGANTATPTCSTT